MDVGGALDLTTSIVMVHGAFCGGWAFDSFREPFEAAGHRVIAPDLPGHGAGTMAVAGRSMSDYAKAIVNLCQAQDAPPILLGHSLGGLVSQMVAARIPLAGLILLAPSAPWGVQGGSAHEALAAVSLYALGPYWAQAIQPDYGAAAQYLLQNLSRDQRRVVFSRMTAESGRAMWETLNWWLDPFATTMASAVAIKTHVLAIAGGKDEIHPPATVKAVAARLRGETRTFQDMGHWLVGEPGWEEVAATCLDWIGEHAALCAA